jgi:hypothetical protein
MSFEFSRMLKKLIAQRTRKTFKPGSRAPRIQLTWSSILVVSLLEAQDIFWATLASL